ncbi:MAG: hypothetical protein CMO44_09245 [Verrucomicrobiales bacterium]|jgi:hypothetical protein|nr:hypothetical protein [Verrucomicrobiales bacterium]|tara:strand:- start:1451 stop:1846 length:396 start_codon:yes stop_codon:yes gene_type:complete
MSEPNQVIYSDFDNLFVSNPITKQLNKKVNRDAVKQSVKNLVLTDFYERPFQSDIGCNIRGYLFEPFTSHLQEQIKQAVINTIENYEPRANLIDILVEDRLDLNGLSLTIAFEIVNDPEAVVLDVLLERVR